MLKTIDICLILVIGAAVGLALRTMYKNRNKKGCGLCGSACSGCNSDCASNGIVTCAVAGAVNSTAGVTGCREPQDASAAAGCHKPQDASAAVTGTIRKAILIFGSFNPVTNAHIYLGIKSKQMINDADVIYIPAKDDYLRGWKGLNDDNIIPERIELLRKATAQYGFKVSTVETDGIVNGKSINTINYLKEKEGYDQVYFVMGPDKAAELERWYKSEELVSQNQFLVFTRGVKLEDVMTDFTERYASHFHKVESDSEYEKISSTRVREALINNDLESIRDMVPKAVYDCLKKKSAKPLS